MLICPAETAPYRYTVLWRAPLLSGIIALVLVAVEAIRRMKAHSTPTRCANAVKLCVQLTPRKGQPMLRAGILATISIIGFTAHAAAQYCAVYNDGSQSCGIPTFQSCLQTVSGVGGNCMADNTSQLPPNLMQRWFGRQQNQSPPAIQNAAPIPLPPSQN